MPTRPEERTLKRLVAPATVKSVAGEEVPMPTVPSWRTVMMFVEVAIVKSAVLAAEVDVPMLKLLETVVVARVEMPCTVR